MEGGLKQMQSNLKSNLELKPSSRTYLNMIFEILPVIFLGQAIYVFKAQEVINSTFQMLHKSELKRSYNHLKMTRQN